MRGMRLRAGDRVRLVAPASFAEDEWVGRVAEVVEGWGLRPEVGTHARDRFGYMAGRDEDRLADLNDAFRDPGVRAVVAITGGAGAYRIVDGIDFTAVRADPKPLVGFSDIVNLHVALWARTGLATVHGCVGPGGRVDATARQLLFETGPITLPGRSIVAGRAEGVLVGGLAGAVGNFVGAGLPTLDGAILCLEGAQGVHFDRFLSTLRRSDLLRGIRGFAVGDLSGAEAGRPAGEAEAIVRDRLGDLGVPILGGLPFGHTDDQMCLPLGVPGIIDTAAGTLTAEPVVHDGGAPTAVPSVTSGEVAWVPGRAIGRLFAADLADLRTRVGAGLPDLTGAILLLTGARTLGLGQVDRQLTHLHRAGVLTRVAGVAVGPFTGFDGFADRGWTLTDVLRDQLSRLSVPVLSGVPLTQRDSVGAVAVLDAGRRTLTAGLT
ncbi:LD-carboxypeptidase [Actinoplanes sp. NPDC049265]|uniref:LD-carboxypeptidase n=1 Tax=Actinoplanes sp. NPDC049265 TaxID=3363902 RepID=UPI0037174DC1